MINVSYYTDERQIKGKANAWSKLQGPFLFLLYMYMYVHHIKLLASLVPRPPFNTPRRSLGMRLASSK